MNGRLSRMREPINVYKQGLRACAAAAAQHDRMAEFRKNGENVMRVCYVKVL